MNSFSPRFDAKNSVGLDQCTIKLAGKIICQRSQREMRSLGRTHYVLENPLCAGNLYSTVGWLAQQLSQACALVNSDHMCNSNKGSIKCGPKLEINGIQFNKHIIEK